MDLGAHCQRWPSGSTDELARQGRELRIEPPEPVVGLWDRGRLDQALTDLVAHAVKHGAAVRVTIRIERHGPAA